MAGHGGALEWKRTKTMPIDRTDQGASASDMGAKLAHLVNAGAIVANHLPDDAAADTFVAALDPAREAIATADKCVAALVEAAQFLANEPNRHGDGWLCDTLREVRSALSSALGDVPDDIEPEEWAARSEHQRAFTLRQMAASL